MKVQALRFLIHIVAFTLIYLKGFGIMRRERTFLVPIESYFIIMNDLWSFCFIVFNFDGFLCRFFWFRSFRNWFVFFLYMPFYWLIKVPWNLQTIVFFSLPPYTPVTLTLYLPHRCLRFSLKFPARWHFLSLLLHNSWNHVDVNACFLFYPIFSAQAHAH